MSSSQSANFVPRILILLFAILLFAYYFLLQDSTDQPLSERSVPDVCYDWLQDEAAENQIFPPITMDTRFVTNHPDVGFCSGLGNQMFRFASLYGIGQILGRRPAYGHLTQCHKAETFPGEMLWIFPVMARNILYIPKDSAGDTHFAKKFASRDCCHWNDPKQLISTEHKYLALGAIYLQNYRYFHDRRSDILQIFRFSPSLCSLIRNYGRELFSEDPPSSHHLCVHTRRGDFFHRDWQSTREFTEKSIEHVISELKKRFETITVVLMGQDKQFLRSLNISKQLAHHRVHLLREQSRGEDLAFGVFFCHSLIITASASTFSWWIGYLMRIPPGGNVFFNANFTGMDRDRANFLPEWIPLILDKKTGTIRRLLN